MIPKMSRPIVTTDFRGQDHVTVVQRNGNTTVKHNYPVYY